MINNNLSIAHTIIFFYLIFLNPHFILVPLYLGASLSWGLCVSLFPLGPFSSGVLVFLRLLVPVFQGVSLLVFFPLISWYLFPIMIECHHFPLDISVSVTIFPPGHIQKVCVSQVCYWCLFFLVSLFSYCLGVSVFLY